MPRTEVNSFFCIKYCLKKDEKFRRFRLILAYSLIHNELWVNRSYRDNLEGIGKNKKVHHFGYITFPYKEMEGVKFGF